LIVVARKKWVSELVENVVCSFSCNVRTDEFVKCKLYCSILCNKVPLKLKHEIKNSFIINSQLQYCKKF